MSTEFIIEDTPSLLSAQVPSDSGPRPPVVTASCPPPVLTASGPPPTLSDTTSTIPNAPISAMELFNPVRPVGSLSSLNFEKSSVNICSHTPSQAVTMGIELKDGRTTYAYAGDLIVVEDLKGKEWGEDSTLQRALEQEEKKEDAIKMLMEHNEAIIRAGELAKAAKSGLVKSLGILAENKTEMMARVKSRNSKHLGSSRVLNIEHSPSHFQYCADIAEEIGTTSFEFTVSVDSTAGSTVQRNVSW